MNKLYRYIVLRLAPDFMRGEIVNVGVVLFPANEDPKVFFMAQLQKLRAFDVEWSRARASEWTNFVREIVQHSGDIEACVKSLNHLGICGTNEPGMFVAGTEQELSQQLSEIRDLYVTPKGASQSNKRERRQRLVSELKDKFRKMNRLGRTIEDLSQHLIVPNVPVPGYPDLKTDFLFKNGVYRITQTLDYRVSVDSAHQKISEACTKSMAAQLAKKEWGTDTVKLAVVNVPEEVAEIADPHIDMLLSQGFSVFHSDNAQDLAHYYAIATGQHSADSDLTFTHRIQ
ncbi:DUF3037 domain-containing protein [Allopusillimonas ginsengisoli]|uniref:DUF3037 domain-containing protein n=1 Tax=Allopusillimonas ginsengisoli TaxID=453575 RepID=UPI0039C4E383